MKVTISLPTSSLRPISLPRPQVRNTFKKLIDLPNVFFDSLPVSFSQDKFNAPSVNFSLTSFKRNHRRLYRALALIIVALILTGAGYFLIQMGRSASTLGADQVSINQTYTISARDSQGNPTGQNLNLVLTSAEKNKSVLIQGKRANVRNGKMFLLVNFEMDNPDNQVYYINPTDLVRYLRDDGKKFAPTVHQGIIQVRPNSTKNSNIGFVIEQDASHFILEVGELEGQKQTLEINL